MVGCFILPLFNWNAHFFNCDWKCILRPFHTRPKKQIQCALNVHSSCSHLNPILGDAHWMCIESIHLWRWIGTKSELNSLFIHRITIKSRMVTSPRTATLSKLSCLVHHTRCISCPRYELWWPIMLGCHWLGAVEKRPLTKWSRVVRRIHIPHKVYYSNKVSQRIGRTLVCVSIHLECWLDKARVEIVAWAAVGVARQQQFSYDSVSKFLQGERDQCGFNLHSMRIGWMWIQFAFKPNQVWKGLKMIWTHVATTGELRKARFLCIYSVPQREI